MSSVGKDEVIGFRIGIVLGFDAPPRFPVAIQFIDAVVKPILGTPSMFSCLL